MKKSSETIYFIFIVFIVFLLSPIFISIALAIFLTSGAPIVYRQKRVGKREKHFTMYKFRTMNINADILKINLRKLNEADGPVFKIHNDPRFTQVGKFLSHIGLDELPQLFNILKGDMVLIGPRPLPPSEVKTLTRQQRARHSVKPGIISPWIVNGYHSQSFSDWMKSDLNYIKKKSFSYDVNIALKSVFFVISMLKKEIKTLLNSRKNTSTSKNLVRQRKINRQYELGKLD